jgi:iron complex transport system substrate-binding protein
MGATPTIIFVRGFLFFEPMKKLFVLIAWFAVMLLPGVANSEPAGQRIVSLAPATTEILFALELGKQVIGVTLFCNYPDQTAGKEKVGSFSSPDIEKIIFLKPDLIFATGLEQAPPVARLRQMGLKVYVSDPQNLEELFQSIAEIGRLTGRQGEAVDLVSRMKQRIKTVREKARRIPLKQRLRVFMEIWQDPMISVGNKSFVDELIGISGGINIAHDVPRPYSYFSAEQVIARDPQCIIFGHRVAREELGALKKRFGWGNISAVREDRIYGDINPDTFLRPGPRIVEGLEAIQEHLYPELYR